MDDGSARATSDVVVLFQVKDGWSIQLVGRHEDTLRNESGTWRFIERVAAFVPQG